MKLLVKLMDLSLSRWGLKQLGTQEEESSALQRWYQGDRSHQDSFVGPSVKSEKGWVIEST